MHGASSKQHLIICQKKKHLINNSPGLGFAGAGFATAALQLARCIKVREDVSCMHGTLVTGWRQTSMHETSFNVQN
jgi:hypothetical protein